MSKESKEPGTWSVTTAVDFSAAPGIAPTTLHFSLDFKNSTGQEKHVDLRFDMLTKVPNGPGVRKRDDPDLNHYRGFFLNVRPTVTLISMSQPDPKTGELSVTFRLHVATTIPENREYSDEEKKAIREFFIDKPYPPATDITTQASIKVLAQFDRDSQNTTVDTTFVVSEF